MSSGKMPSSPHSASKGFSSTPRKYSVGKDVHRSRSVDVLSEDDTYSLLSPIYHDSFDSDEDLSCSSGSPPDRTLTQAERGVQTLHLTNQVLCRCELPKSRTEQLVTSAVEPAASSSLSAWEKWLVNKAKDDLLKLEKKAEEERLLKERQEQQEREKEQKKIVIEEKIHEWLKIKSEQEKQDKLVKQRKEQEEIERQQMKQREIEHRAQEKYKEWLQKKNQNKMEKEKREKAEAAWKQEQEKERQKRAEEKFKQWLANANEKSRGSPKSSCYPRSPYDKAYPSPSFYNPVPWKPIHVPASETPLKNTSSQRKPQKCHQSPGVPFRLRSATQLWQSR
ncbi:LOW QUALITY PROTEIN: coiled-coil domain-containing protein 34 [Diretmus argenteus]